MVADFEADLIRLRTGEGVQIAKAKSSVARQQPKLNPRQDALLVGLLKSGADSSTAELGELFGVARSTNYRAIARDAARETRSTNRRHHHHP